MFNLRSYDLTLGVLMELQIANSVLPRNLNIKIIIERDLVKVINIYNGCMSNIEKEINELALILDLEIQGHNNVNETEACVTIEADI